MALPPSPPPPSHPLLDPTSPTSDGSAAAIVCSERFVKSRGLQGQAVEIVGQEMVTDFPSTFNEGSCMKMVSALATVYIGLIHSLFIT